MIRIATALRLILLCISSWACNESPDDRAMTDTLPGDASRLVGTWDLTLHSRRRLLGSSAAPVATGRLTFRPMPSEDASSTPLHAGQVTGVVTLSEFGPLRVRPRADTAHGFVSKEGALRIVLQLAGRCSDCGNIHLVGQWEGVCAKGTWEQELPGGGATGRFTLARATPDLGNSSSPRNDRCD